MRRLAAKLNATTSKLILTYLAILTIAGLTACGSNTIAPPTESSTAKPTATFQSIQVTVPPREIPTPTPVPAGTPTTKGSVRSFPELLKNPEGLTIGPLVTTWQDFLNDSVMTFTGNTWDLCGRGNGVSSGEIMNGGIVWTIGLPREGMLGNEIFFTLWNPEGDIGRAYVLGYENETPVLKIVTNYRYTDTVTPFTYRDDPIPFESFELTTCLNL